MQSAADPCRSGSEQALQLGNRETCVSKNAARRARKAPAASVDIDEQGELIRNAELGDESGKSFPQVRDSSLRGVTLPIGPYARPQLRVSTPDTILVLLDGVRDMHGLGHRR
jgi:hypothetical protein